MTRKANKAKTGKAAVALSDVQKKIVSLMARQDGASRAELLKALPDSKPNYIAACMHRILRQKGIRFAAFRDGGEVRYRIT